MPKRSERLRIVLDTNVVIRHFLSQRQGKKANFNWRVVELWLVKKHLQLIVSQEIIAEYLAVMDRTLGMPAKLLQKWERRFFGHNSDAISLGKRFPLSRDPKDNVFLAAAAGGKADFLITNDRDLLEIAEADQRRLKFKITTPEQFLAYWESSS